MKWSGHFEALARPVIGSVEVLEAKIAVGPDHGLRLDDDLGLHLRVLEHGLHDEVAVVQVVVIGARRDAGEQRVAVGRLGAALHDLVAHELVRMGLALLGGFHALVDEHHLQPGVRRHIGDARAHEAGPKHADLLIAVGGTSFGRRAPLFSSCMETNRVRIIAAASLERRMLAK